MQVILIFLHSINKCSNIIVRQCMFTTLQNANNIIGYIWVFYRCKFGFKLLDRDLKYCSQCFKPASLFTEKTVSRKLCAYMEFSQK